jgi:hypothetical protein
MAKPKKQQSSSVPPLADGITSDEDVAASRAGAAAGTGSADVGELAVEPSAPEEITGRAARTTEDLAVLFGNQSDEHLADGFRGGSADDQSVEPPDDDMPELDRG